MRLYHFFLRVIIELFVSDVPSLNPEIPLVPLCNQDKPFRGFRVSLLIPNSFSVPTVSSGSVHGQNGRLFRSVVPVNWSVCMFAWFQLTGLNDLAILVNRLDQVYRHHNLYPYKLVVCMPFIAV